MRANQNYQSYLLRVWREGLGDERRASLQNIISGEISYFANLNDMFAFLCTKVQAPPYIPRQFEDGNSIEQVDSKESRERRNDQ